MKNRKLLIAFAAVLACIVAAAILSWLGSNRAGNELSRAQQEWVVIGGKLDPAELNKPLIPDEVNAAVLYDQAFALTRSISDEDWEVIVSPTDLAALEAILSKHRDALEQVLAGAAKHECNWGADYSAGTNVLLPHVNKGRTLQKLLRAEIHAASMRGDWDAATRAVHSGLNLSEHVAGAPSAVEFLVRLALDAIIYDALQKDFQEHHLVEAATIAKHFNQRDYQSELRQALMGEVPMFLSSMDSTMAQSPAWHRVMNGTQMIRAQAYLLREMKRQIATLDSPYHERQEFSSSIPAPSDQESSLLVYVPDIPKLRQTVEHSETQRRQAICAFALRAYRAEHSEYPATWEMPIDPFTGLPMTYERTEDGGFLLRSVGPALEHPIEWRWK